MRKLRTLAALALTLPLYLGCGLLHGHPFAREWERHAKRLFN